MELTGAESVKKNSLVNLIFLQEVENQEYLPLSPLPSVSSLPDADFFDSLMLFAAETEKFVLGS